MEEAQLWTEPYEKAGAGGKGVMKGRPSFPCRDSGLKKRVLALFWALLCFPMWTCRCVGLGGPRTRWLSSPPPRHGARWFAPRTSLFGAVLPTEVGSGAVTAGGSAAGRGGRGRPRPRPGPRSPTSRACPSPGQLVPLASYRAPRSLPWFSRSPAAGRAGGRRRPCRC